MDVLQGRKGALSPRLRGCSSSQSRSCCLFMGFFPQTRDLGSLGTEGHPRGSRGGAGTGHGQSCARRWDLGARVRPRLSLQGGVQA